MKKYFAVLLMFFLINEIPFAVGQNENKPEGQVTNDWLIENTDDHITLIDENGKQVRIQKPVKTIICLGGETDHTVITAIGAESKVVAVCQLIQSLSHLKKYLPRLQNLPVIGNVEGLDYEKILTLKPDLVIAPFYVGNELEKNLEPEITVFRISIGQPATYYTDVMKISSILDAVDGAREYIDWIKSKVNPITEKTGQIAEEDRITVFDFYGGDWGQGSGPPYGTYGKNNKWANHLLAMAGGINISGSFPGDWITVDAEWLVTKNPQMIIREVCPPITPVMGFGIDSNAEVAAMFDSIIRTPEIAVTDAVKKGRLRLVLVDCIQCYWFIGLQYMAKWFHPDVFVSLNPGEVYREFLTRFMGLGDKSSIQGAFVYPE